jgi:hypothetical protein
MDIPVLRMRDGVKLITENSIGGEPGEIYLLPGFRDGFQDIKVYALRPAQGISVEKKEKAGIRFFPEKRQRIKNNQ